MTVYAVRNRDGQWFRAKGYGGYGATWVDSLERAKLYARLSQARGRLTYFARAFPEYGVPEVVAFELVEREVLNESDRTKKAIAKTDAKRAEFARRCAAWLKSEPRAR